MNAYAFDSRLSFFKKDKHVFAKCQTKPKHFIQTKKRACGWKSRHYTVFRRLNESTKNPRLPPAGVKQRFFAKKIKKIKKVLDKPARISYSPAVNEEQ